MPNEEHTYPLPTREELRSIRSLRREVEEGRAHLNCIRQGSRGEMWYASDEYRALVEENINRLNRTLERLQAFINGIEDSRTRRVFTMHYIYGWSWQKIAFQIEASSESTPRLLHTRYLEKLPRSNAAENNKKA